MKSKHAKIQDQEQQEGFLSKSSIMGAKNTVDQDPIRQRFNEIEYNPDHNQGRKFAAGLVFYQDKYSLRRCLDSLSRNNVDYVFCIDGRFKQFGVKDQDPDLSTDGSRELVMQYDNTILIDVPDSYEVQKREAYLQACRDFEIDYLLIIDSDEYILYDDNDEEHPGTNWERFVDKCIRICESDKYKEFNVFSVDIEIKNKDYVDTLNALTDRRGRFTTANIDKLTGQDRRKEEIAQLPQVFDEETGRDMTKIPMRRRQFMQHPRLWRKPGEMRYNGKHYAFHPITSKNDFHKMESVPAMWHIPFLKLGHDHIYKQQRSKYQNNRLKYQAFLRTFEQKVVNQFYNSGHRHINVEDLDKMEAWYREFEQAKADKEKRALERSKELAVKRP